MRNSETKNEVDEIKNWEDKVKLKELIYRANKYMIFNNKIFW